MHESLSVCLSVCLSVSVRAAGEPSLLVPSLFNPSLQVRREARQARERRSVTPAEDVAPACRGGRGGHFALACRGGRALLRPAHAGRLPAQLPRRGARADAYARPAARHGSELRARVHHGAAVLALSLLCHHRPTRELRSDKARCGRRDARRRRRRRWRRRRRRSERWPRAIPSGASWRRRRARHRLPEPRDRQVTLTLTLTLTLG